MTSVDYTEFEQFTELPDDNPEVHDMTCTYLEHHNKKYTILCRH